MDWDWNPVTTGEWWVFVGVLVALLLGMAVGYALGRRAERRRLVDQGPGYVPGSRTGL